MNILVLGSGAREHALTWKIGQSPKCKKVYLHPGNAGTKLRGFETLPIKKMSPELVYDEVTRLKIDLVVIGPEVYLHQGYADFLRQKNVLVYGPGKNGARLETSKIFSKEFMVRANIPTASYQVLKSFEDFRPAEWPIVLKFDGLAAGKGVVIAKNENEAADFFQRVWTKKEFGEGAILAEEFVPGTEISYMGFCDGKTFLPLTSATDYKRVFEKDQGPNTGGMGAISPSPYLTKELDKTIQERIVQPILNQLHNENIFYRGTLYIGLMIDAEGKPFVLEFNARFGDPETQAILMRLKSDFVDVLLSTAKGELAQHSAIIWSEEKSLYVVAAAHGYPDAPRIGDRIEGLENESGATVFFAGVGGKSEELVTSGGRVLGVGALGSRFSNCRDKVYTTLSRIRFDGMHYRKDIGEV